MKQCLRYSIFIYLLASTAYPVTTSASSAPTACNGYKDLCNKKYNEICFVSTHNGASYTNSPVQDQDMSVLEQAKHGVRATKTPVHKDYENRLGYYDAMLRAYINHEKAQRDHILADIQAQLQKPLQDLNDAQAKVNSLQQHINDVSHNIDAKKNWYDHLSLGDQIAQAIPYAAEMGAMEADKVGTQGALATANGVLDLARQVVEKVPTNTDPRVLALNTHIGILEQIRTQIVEKGGPDAFNQTLFACHGLYKGELYSAGKYLNDMLNDCPETLKPILAPIVADIQKSLPDLMTELFGTASQPGGLLPYTPCLIEPGSLPFRDILNQIKTFLDQNPNEIFTLTIENAANASFEEFANVFTKVGLINYVHAQDQNKAWPTLAEMIKSGKRLVVFIYGNGNPSYPWLNAANFFFPWSNKWDYTTTDELINADPAKTIKNPSVRDNLPPFNKLFDIPHAVTPGFAGDKKMAAIINARSILAPRVKKHMQIVDHIVNFFGVDFFEHPSTNGVPDVVDVCNEVNGVGNYISKPLFVPTPPTKTEIAVATADVAMKQDLSKVTANTQRAIQIPKTKSTF